MRAANGKSVPELAQQISELTVRVADLTRRIGLAEGVNGNGRHDQKSDALVRDTDDSRSSIEFITENGFSIVRPWESEGAPPPADGKCCFRVSHWQGHEGNVNVEFSSRAVAEVVLQSRGEIPLSSSFWICCAERRLAKYVTEHDDFPEGNQIIVEALDREDVLLAIRWGKSG